MTFQQPRRADVEVTVPARAEEERWSAEAAQLWARTEVLFGGPPDKPFNPRTGQTVDWSEVKHWTGKKLRIMARPMGLLITSRDGTVRYVAGDGVPSAGVAGFAMGTSVATMRKQTALENEIRDFARKEIERYNKTLTKAIRDKENRTTTREFWDGGKRIREFIAAHGKKVNQDQVWYALEQWGRGAFGYSKAWYEDACYLYDWTKDAPPSDPLFALNETRLMNIRRATPRDEQARRRLLNANVDGVFADFGDEEFKWVTGQSRGNFPLGEEVHSEFSQFGEKVAAGKALDERDLNRLRELRELIRAAPRRSQAAADITES